MQFGDDRLRLGPVDAAPAALEQAVHKVQRHLPDSVVRGGEGKETSVIELLIAEGNEALVAASVMPGQIELGQIDGDTVLQNAAQVVLQGIFDQIDLPGKEIGGRHLVGISDNDRVPAPCQNTDGIGCRDLRGLVKDHQVEGRPIRCQVLCGADRAHEHTGAQAGKDRRSDREDITDAHALSSAENDLAECGQQRIVRCLLDKAGNIGAKAHADFLPRQLCQFLIPRADRGDLFLQQDAGKGVEDRILLDHFAQDGPGPGLLPADDHILVRKAPAVCFDHAVKFKLRRLLPRAVPQDPFAQTGAVFAKERAELSLGGEPVLLLQIPHFLRIPALKECLEITLLLLQVFRGRFQKPDLFTQDGSARPFQTDPVAACQGLKPLCALNSRLNSLVEKRDHEIPLHIPESIQIISACLQGLPVQAEFLLIILYILCILPQFPASDLPAVCRVFSQLCLQPSLAQVLGERPGFPGFVIASPQTVGFLFLNLQDLGSEHLEQPVPAHGQALIVPGRRVRFLKPGGKFRCR